MVMDFYSSIIIATIMILFFIYLQFKKLVIMDISFFRSRIQGPEILLEDIVTNNIDSWLSYKNVPSWVACSPQVGAGMPDILFAIYNPEIYALSGKNNSHSKLLAFLRAVNGAEFDSILFHLKFSKKELLSQLDEFIEKQVIDKSENIYILNPNWECIIPTIISIEVKVNNWQVAVSQASRNRLFSNKSYVALPTKTSNRTKDLSIWAEKEIGLLAIDTDSISEEICAPTTTPQVWEYYYWIAVLIATNHK